MGAPTTPYSRWSIKILTMVQQQLGKKKKQLSTISVTFSLCCRKKKWEKTIHKNSCTNYFKWAHPSFCAGCRAEGQPHSAASAACSRAAKSREPLAPLPPWWMCSAALWKSPGSCVLVMDSLGAGRLCPTAEWDSVPQGSLVAPKWEQLWITWQENRLEIGSAISCQSCGEADGVRRLNWKKHKLR